ncbi:hypothetical protein [Frigoribacterium sp. UYMn621]|uniref:hypothetical protein n=1 Tax=Frigoribacterium sp. UYMn621 TaxID=3156343 RepID=UPI0033994492
MPDRPNLTFLLDTNAIIALEPFAGSMELSQAPLAQFVASAHENGHRIVAHPANRDDLLETADDGHRNQNLAALKKYGQIIEVNIPAQLEILAGQSKVGTNDYRDLRLLAAVYAGAATHLVTADMKLRRRAERAGLGNQVISADAALDLLNQLHPSDPPTPPSVERIEAANLDLSQPIFESLREDYPEFDDWLRKVASQQTSRRTWVVVDSRGHYRAIAIVKLDDDHPTIPGNRATKLSTFKVDAGSEGEKLGELLLKTVLNWAHRHRVDKLFVTVLDDESKQSLLHFLHVFGFVPIGAVPKNEHEHIFMKHFVADTSDAHTPLQYHVLHGPPAILGTAAVYVVPIIPRWYEGLFPDAPSVGPYGQTTLGGLLADTAPFGNALRKAYLSNANTKELPPGSTILFYRSAGPGGGGVVQAIGVVEATARSSSPGWIVSFVGRRTVYSADEVARLCEDGNGRQQEVLAILFRQDRFVEPPWTLKQLIARSRPA